MTNHQTFTEFLFKKHGINKYEELRERVSDEQIEAEEWRRT